MKVFINLCEKSNFGINHGMLNSHELSTDRSHRRMVSLPSDQAIANILSGSFNVHHHHQPSSVGQVRFFEIFFINFRIRLIRT